MYIPSDIFETTNILTGFYDVSSGERIYGETSQCVRFTRFPIQRDGHSYTDMSIKNFRQIEAPRRNDIFHLFITYLLDKARNGRPPRKREKEGGSLIKIECWKICSAYLFSRIVEFLSYLKNYHGELFEKIFIWNNSIFHQLSLCKFTDKHTDPLLTLSDQVNACKLVISPWWINFSKQIS